MSKVIISGFIDFGDRDVTPILQGARELIEMTYDEPGCIHYVWSADVLRPGRVWVYEEWQSVETLAAHLVADSYLRMSGYLAQSGLTGATVNKYLIATDEPVYDATGVARAEFSNR